MIRALFNACLSLLLTATLVWGGCISCSQFFMFPQAEKKSCCNKTGQCERPAKTAPLKECAQLPLELQDSPHVQADLPVVAMLPAGAMLPASGTLVALARPHDEAPPRAASPPDLLVLHSTFLL